MTSSVSPTPLVLWRFMGKGPVPSDDINKARTLLGVTIVNDSLPRGVALRLDHPAARTVLEKIPGWALFDSQDVDLIDGPHG